MAQPFLYAIYPVPPTNALQLAVETSKASSRRNAEVIMVREITRWRSEVERFAPARLVEFDLERDSAQFRVPTRTGARRRPT